MSAENHNHITRDIKPPGQCYSCDRYHAMHGEKERIALRNIIYGTLESAEQDGHERAFRYLTMEAQARNITRYESDF